jgi:all-trans-retinol 13,14-reductase
MRVGKSYKQHGVTGSFDAIVIGSGIGGLGCAGLLARHGKRVLVLERHYTAGGFTHSFKRPGYDWDVGVHYLGELGEGTFFSKLYRILTDSKLEWADMGDVYDRIIMGDRHYDFHRGAEAFAAGLTREFPGHEDEINRYVRLVQSTRKGGGFALGSQKVLPGLVQGLIRPFTSYAGRHIRRTTGEVMDSLTSNPELKGVLCGQWGDYGLPPAQSSFFMHCVVAGHYLDGAWYPVGGASRIGACIEQGIVDAGGLVLTNAPVERIVVEKGRAVGVVIAGGEEVRAPTVIAATGVRVLAGGLLDDESRSAAGLPAPGALPSPSGAHMSLYVGLNKSDADLGLSKTNLWVYPGPDHDANVAAFQTPDDPFAVVYLSFPSAKDPDFQNRHPGHGTVEAVTLAPYQWFAPWESTSWRKRGDDYEALKAKLAQRLQAVLEEQVPALKGAIAYTELSTPLSTRHFAAHPYGEIYGLAHTPQRFEEGRRYLRPRTRLPGLFLAGADVGVAGVGGALAGGMAAATSILGKNPLSGLSGR